MDNTQQQKPDRKGFAIASLILGIVSVIPWLITLINFLWKPVTISEGWIFNIWILTLLLNIVSGIVGLVLGVIGLKSSKKVFANIGMALCIIGLLYFPFLFFAFWLAIGEMLNH